MTTSAVALATTSTVTAVTAPESVLDQGLPRGSSYSFIDVTVNEAVLASVEPRTYLHPEPAPGPRHLFLERAQGGYGRSGSRLRLTRNRFPGSHSALTCRSRW